MQKPLEILNATFNPKIKKYIFAYVAFVMIFSVIGIPFLLIWILGIGQMVSKKYYENLTCKLTTVHLEFKKGVLFKVEKTIPLENIQDLTFIENPILNYFGLKILKIETAGHSAANKADMNLVGIIDAFEFKEAVLRQREMLKQQPSTKNEDSDEVVNLLKDIKNLLKQLNDKA